MGRKRRLTVKQVVARGMKHLDKVLPGWDVLIDLDNLELASGASCVLGQLRARAFTLRDGFQRGYSDVVNNLDGINGFVNDAMYETSWTATNGFDSDSDAIDYDGQHPYDALNDEWQRQIGRRHRSYDRHLPGWRDRVAARLAARGR